MVKWTNLFSPFMVVKWTKNDPTASSSYAPGVCVEFTIAATSSSLRVLTLNGTRLCCASNCFVLFILGRLDHRVWDFASLNCVLCSDAVSTSTHTCPRAHVLSLSLSLSPSLSLSLWLHLSLAPSLLLSLLPSRSAT